MEGDGAVPVKLHLDEMHHILRVKEVFEDGSEQQDGKKIDKLSKKTSKVIARWSLNLTADSGVWDSSGHHDTHQIEEYKKAARNLGIGEGEKAPHSQ